MNGWWSNRSLRFRLAAWYALGGTFLLTAFSAVVYGFVARHLAIGPVLREDLNEIAARLAITADGTLRWDGQDVRPGVAWPADRPWFEIWNEHGHLVRRLWPFADERLDHVPQPPTRDIETLAVFRVAPTIPLRTLSAPYAVPGRERVWMLRAMRVHEPATEVLAALLGIILVSLPAMVAVLVVGGYLITRHWLKPLERMARQAEGITANNLALRLPEAGTAAELDRLAGAFNRTLGRLEDSFRTLDRFVGDASHELRTPLTTLRSVGEVGLRRSRTVEEYREIIGSMLEEADRLHRLVERLLELASTEGGAKAPHREWLELGDFVRTCADELGVLAEFKSQALAIEAAPCRVQADPVLLHQALQNLIDNAMKYSPAGATIRITVERQGGECRIAVMDEGPGIPPEHLARLADRFHRVEDSRVRGQGGFGLGLAITKAYMRVMGGRLEYAPGRPHGACFALVLPAEVD